MLTLPITLQGEDPYPLWFGHLNEAEIAYATGGVFHPLNLLHRDGWVQNGCWEAEITSVRLACAVLAEFAFRSILQPAVLYIASVWV